MSVGKDIHIGLPLPETVRKAINVYMKIAYPTGPPPLAVRNLLSQISNEENDFYGNPAFTRVGSERTPCYYLRLGNCNYPHMKLQIETWPGGLQYFFRADTHDRHITVPQNHPEFRALAELSKRNQEIAEVIEGAWQRAGLPTFKGHLGEDLAHRRKRSPQENHGQATHDSGD